MSYVEDDVEPEIDDFEILDDCDKGDPCQHTVVLKLLDASQTRVRYDAHTIVGMLKNKDTACEHFEKYQTFASGVRMKND